MSKNVKNQKSVELNLVAEVAKRLSNGGLKPADVQALLEKKPSGESSLDDKIVAKFIGYGFTEANFNETIVYCGQLMKRHRNGGGWVPVMQSMVNPSMPYVSPKAFVNPTSIVCGNAKLYDNVCIGSDSLIHGRANLFDEVYVRNSHIHGTVSLSGDTRVVDAHIVGSFSARGGHVSGRHGGE